MTIHDRNDAILVRLTKWNEEKGFMNVLSSYYTTAFDQTLRMFKFCKDENISIFDSNEEEYYINNITVTFGNNNDEDGKMTCIDVEVD